MTWMTPTDEALVRDPEEKDFYFSCGCWSGQADHTCQSGCSRCGAPDDCYCGD